MQINSFVAVLDTCVLAPMPLADTLLRLAEEPAFYLPRWSHDILDELRRTLTNRFNYPEDKVCRRLEFMALHFPEALVNGYEDLIPSMKTDPKDAHVLAAAIRGGAHAIVTDNVRDFPLNALKPYGIERLTAAEFLLHQYHLDSDAFISLLIDQAKTIGKPLNYVLSKLPPSVASLINP